MALTDLKKNSTRSTNRTLSVDEFIADAEHYAMGAPTQVPTITKIVPEPSPTASAQLNAGPMRHATFTLSHEAIELLNQLSQETGMSKSKLIRQLIFSFNENVDSPVTPAVVVKKVE